MDRYRDCLHQEGILGSAGIESQDLPTPCKEMDPEEPGGSVLAGGPEGRKLSHWSAHPILSFCSGLTAAMPLSLDHTTCIRMLALPLWRQVTCSWTGFLNFISPGFLTSKTGVEYPACFLQGPSFCERRCRSYGRHDCVSPVPLAIVWSKGRKQTCQVMCLLSITLAFSQRVSCQGSLSSGQLWPTEFSEESSSLPQVAVCVVGNRIPAQSWTVTRFSLSRLERSHRGPQAVRG